MEILDKYLSRGRRVAFRVYDGLALIVLMPRNNTELEAEFELSSAGTYLWKLLEKNPKGSDIVSLFMKKYSISRKDAVQQVTGYVKMLHKQELVEISKKPGFEGRPWLA